MHRLDVLRLTLSEQAFPKPGSARWALIDPNSFRPEQFASACAATDDRRGGHRIVPDDADHPAQPLVWRDAALMVGSQNCGANPTVGLIDILRTDNERSDAKPVTGPVDHRP